MMSLSESERISMIRSAFLIQITHVTDRRTDGIGVAYTRYSIYAVARKKRYYRLGMSLYAAQHFKGLNRAECVTSGVSMPPTMLTPRLPQPVYTSIVVTDSSSTGVDIIRHIRCFAVTSTNHRDINGTFATSH